MVRQFIILSAAVIFVLFCYVSDSGEIGVIASDRDYSQDQIYTVLAFDAIPAIKNPQFVSASEAKLRDDSPMIGVSFNGESHAYSILFA